MYLDHFGLKEAPFRITPVTDFFSPVPIALRYWMP